MEDLKLKKLLLGTSLLTGFAMFGLATPAYAQDANEEPIAVETVEEDEEEEEANKNDIVVTGSRIKRDTFSSIAPIQIIDFGDKAAVGLIDPVTILQTTESAAGQQIDSTFGGFVLDNGPGSETVNIRGLGAARTLLMVNNRRLAPAGVEGAPSQPSLNLIPSSLIDRVEILLEGASSIYGSDAVAGTVNLILRRDFEGFEVTGTADVSQDSGGQDFNIAASYGKNFDRGFLGFGAEYDFRDAVKLGDRDFLAGCDTHYEIDENGNIRTQDQQDQYRFDVWYGGGFQAGDQGECKADGIAGRLAELSGTFGSIYFQDGITNTGIPNYVDQNLAGVPVDADGDGVQDYGFQQFSINGNDLEADLIPEQKRINLMAYGEYTLEGDANLTPFFEVIHSNAQSDVDNGTAQLFPRVSATNPFNPCGTSGVDCGSNSFDFNAGFLDRWNAYYRDPDPNRDGNFADARTCATFRASFDADGQVIPGSGPFDNAGCTPFIFGFGPTDFVGPTGVQPVVGVNGDRTNVSTEIEQTRLVGGFKGDLPFMNFGEFSDWTFEASLMHSVSKGSSSRPGIRNDRLNFALGNDIVTGNPINGLAPCTAAPGVTVRPDVLAGCVPVNLFAPSLYNGIAGDLATQAERDYLFDSRDFDTQYKQTVWNAFVTGKVMELPAGPLSAVLGMEYRVDEINSSPDEIARDGLFFGFFSDGGAQGKKFERSMFAELDIPVVADKPFFRQLDVNLSGRILEEEFYGGASTYSAKVGWRPFDNLLLKANYGTSFRSPNLRENFLQPQSGFLTVLDPCAVPLSATVRNLGAGGNVYDPTRETREQFTLDACTAAGINPTTFNLGGGQAFSTETFRQGTLDLDPEEGTSLNLGFSYEQNLTDAFDLSFGATYYELDVRDSVVAPNAQFIVNDCFATERPAGQVSPFCSRITRTPGGTIDLIDQEFINLDQNKVRGVDVNAEFNYEFNAFDKPFDLLLDLRANHLISASTLFTAPDVPDITDNDEGEFGFADWTGTLRARLSYQDFALNWETRYISSVEQDIDTLDEFGNALGVDTDNNGLSDAFSDTCGGPAAGDVNCRDVGFADDYFVHQIGLSYTNDVQDWGITVAVRNVFNQDPPKVDSSEVLAVSNTPIGAGYDLEGRKFFVQLRKGF